MVRLPALSLKNKTVVNDRSGDWKTEGHNYFNVVYLRCKYGFDSQL